MWLLGKQCVRILFAYHSFIYSNNTGTNSIQMLWHHDSPWFYKLQQENSALSASKRRPTWQELDWPSHVFFCLLYSKEWWKRKSRFSCRHQHKRWLSKFCRKRDVDWPLYFAIEPLRLNNFDRSPILRQGVSTVIYGSKTGYPITSQDSRPAADWCGFNKS